MLLNLIYNYVYNLERQETLKDYSLDNDLICGWILIQIYTFFAQKALVVSLKNKRKMKRNGKYII